MTVFCQRETRPWRLEGAGIDRPWIESICAVNNLNYEKFLRFNEYPMPEAKTPDFRAGLPNGSIGEREGIMISSPVSQQQIERNLPRARGYTRALKNARFLQAAAPEVFLKDPKAVGFGTGIPLNILLRLNRLQHSSPLLSQHPQVSEFLKAYRLPVPSRGLRDALFSGTIYFAQVTFNTNIGALVMPTADMNTIIQYAQHAIVPISLYVSQQYGWNKVSVSPNLLTYAANVPTGTFTDPDLGGWVNDMVTANNLPSDSCIYVICPQRISANGVGGDAGYHSLANIPYIVAGVYATGLTLQDEADVYAMTISHEMAEMIVDPKVDAQNPEVCDPCDINCNNLTRSYFAFDGTYLGSNQLSPPGGFNFAYYRFNFAYYICAVVMAEGAANCPASAADCQYSPTDIP